MTHLLPSAIAACLACSLLLPAQPGKTTPIQVDKEFKLEGRLTTEDPKDKKINNSPSQTYLVEMKAGNAYTIDMISNELDSYLRLEDKEGKQLDEDDDSGGQLNARMVFNCTKDDNYKIICTCLANERGGNYTLTIKKSVSTVKNVTAHDVLIGKPAPDFEGDFALNGQPVKLSALKGKVVLVQFWDARSDACVATIGRLRDWSSKLKGDGLEVVGVTFYLHEIDQKMAFDKDLGRLKRVEMADKKTEQEALKELAAYHKLEHLLIALPRQEAARVFDAYTVNGVPLAVIIDRKGTIRAVQFDEEKGAPNLESQIKKLLAEQ